MSTTTTTTTTRDRGDRYGPIEWAPQNGPNEEVDETGDLVLLLLVGRTRRSVEVSFVEVLADD